MVRPCGHGKQHTIPTNGVSRLQTNKYNSTCWPYCHGHALPPSWLKACNPARNGVTHDHNGFYHIPTKQKRRSTGQGAEKPLDHQRSETKWVPDGAFGHEPARPKRLTFPIRDFSKYACGLADGTL